MGLQDDIDILENLDKLFMSKRVSVIAIEDIDPSKVDNVVDHIIKKNTKFNVPLSIALKLVKEGSATVPEENIVWMKKIIWKEKSRSRLDILVKHEDDFYQKLVLTLYAINYDKSGLKLEEELRTHISHLAKQILIKRLTILLSKAASDTKSIIQNTAPEEDLLFRIVKNVVDKWMEKLHINDF